MKYVVIAYLGFHVMTCTVGVVREKIAAGRAVNLFQLIWVASCLAWVLGWLQ